MRISVKSMCRISIIAALYFVITMVCKPFVFGPVEFRLSEMLNFLMFIDPVYIIGITSKRMWTGIVYATLGTSAIAWELWFFFGLPFWYQFAVGGFGELVSMVLGYILARCLFKNDFLVRLFKCTPGNTKEIKF